MRLNAFIAKSSELSRRSADEAIGQNRVLVNGQRPTQGQQVTSDDNVTLDGKILSPVVEITTIVLNKPIGYVCSRDGQGNPTIFELLPEPLQHLNNVGRLDKDSSGLILLTNDGQLSQRLSHPSYQKIKVYKVALSTALTPLHHQMISDIGISLSDGVSKLQLERLDDSRKNWQVTMREGRNRQIRRTFAALGYNLNRLHRTQFGGYALNDLKPGDYKKV